MLSPAFSFLQNKLKTSQILGLKFAKTIGCLGNLGHTINSQINALL